MISLVVPTFNEVENIENFLHETFKVLEKENIEFEIIVVDDSSDDGTQEILRRIAKEDKRLRLFERRERGMASAFIFGFKKANGNIVGKIDADFSHPPTDIPKVLEPIFIGKALISIGSRFIRGAENVAPFNRKIISSLGSIIARRVLKKKGIYVKDPLSGFFFFKKEVIKDVEDKVFKICGAKILLNILFYGKHLGKIEEVPIHHRWRKKGKSKFNTFDIVCFAKQVLLLKKESSII